MVNVLVTGGAGFIGSHIVKQCIKHKFKTIVLDNLANGKKENVHPAATFYKMDIRSAELSDLFIQEKIEYVFHLAAQIDVQSSLEKPIYDASVNILGSLNILEASRKNQVRKVIYSSSAAVYGEPLYLPVDENHSPNPQAIYGLSKLVVEKYLKMYQHLYGLDYSVLRYSNVYGPRQEITGEGGVVAIFINKIINGEKPIIYGSGQQTRDFVFVDDVAKANLLSVTKGSGSIINISTGRRTTINELFRLIAKLSKSTIEPVFKEERAGDIKDSSLDRRKAKELLGWEPETSIDEGLAIMLKT